MAIARKRVPQYVKRFYAADWYNNKIEIIPTGIPTAGQLGPHLMPGDGLFETEVYQYRVGGFLESITVRISQYASGLVVVEKTPLTPNFNGILMLRLNRYE